jgi:hypothetical protein
MKNFIIILIFLISINCVNKTENSDESLKVEANNEAPNPEIKTKVLAFIDNRNDIELSQTDDKYGEWGGDTDLIKIYSDGDKLYADYYKYLGSKKPPSPPKENEKQKKWYEYKTLDTKIDSIELNDNEKHLAELSIVELIKYKVRNESIQLGGIINKIVSKDSSLIINDCNSIKWKSFQMLKTELIKK